MPTFSGSAAWVTGSAATLAAVVYLVTLCRRFVHWLLDGVHMFRAMHELVTRELTHNHGSSMKDDVVGMAVAIGELQRKRDEDRRRLNLALYLAARHHPEDPWLSRLISEPEHPHRPHREDETP